jgi:hypothetical protein
MKRAFSLVLLAACNGSNPPPVIATPTATQTATATPPAPKKAYSEIPRLTFNQLAARHNLPLFWTSDRNNDGAIDPDEVASLMFYPSEGKWTAGGKFTPEFEAAYQAMLKSDSGGDERRKLVVQELDQGIPTLVYNDLRSLSEGEKTFVRHILAASKRIDELHAFMAGATALKDKVPEGDAASQSMFRRNWGAKCVAPKTEKNPACSAVPGAPAQIVDIYPEAMQKDPKFCEAIEKHPDAKKLLDPFVVVRDKGGKLAAVPYTEAYKDRMAAIAGDLKQAAATTAENEPLLKAYLLAAARSFETNDWGPADEAWSKMSAASSKWYLRVAPDETYWEPCAHKAGFHVTFALINKDSLKWQEKLTPLQQKMEKHLADLIGAPYKERKVTFHLPDFIDIVVNAGDDRHPIAAVIGQSLPNWGKVPAEGRGRTVVMSNLYTDPDSIARRRRQAESVLTKESMATIGDTPQPGLLGTILHEATHNLGPTHEYKVKGKNDSEAFGGQLASMMEENKAQAGALFYVNDLVAANVIDKDMGNKAWTDSVVWSFGHISEGMYTEKGGRKPYSQLAAIHIGFLMDEGALTFDPSASAANGADKGAFVIHLEKFPAAVEKLMKVVGSIKGQADKAGAEALAKKYVDGDVVPQKLIAERYLRSPKASFVYALDL